MACDIEPLSQSQNTIKTSLETRLGLHRYFDERLRIYYWGDDASEPVGEPAPRILEWTEKTIENVIEALTREQADETCQDTDLELNLPWNSPLVTGPLIVSDQLQQRLSPSKINLRTYGGSKIP
ncbi:hypothetical protein FS837_011108 [Tulasnella sp. UAMH 9824]|nr:hypothetical protein FS837_011108 [Tulasnella sp. UAMH 9824]